MANSKLLKEAIADAKAVKETALANAKSDLQEAFAPRLERMLATKLTNEIEGEEELQEPNLDDMGDDVPVEDETTDGAVDWVDNDISFSVGGNTYDAEIDNSMEDEQSMEEPEMGGEEEAPMSNDEMSDEYNENYEMEDDLNLEEIIRELEGDLDEPIAEPEPIIKPEPVIKQQAKQTKKRTRCPNGTRKNKETGKCEKYSNAP